MRFHSPSTLLFFLAISSSLPSFTFAIDLLRARSIPRALGVMLWERDCPVTCGYYNQLCCQANQACLTINNQAACGQATATGNNLVAGVGNGYQMFTTTYTGLTTVTSTYSLPISQTTQALVATCLASLSETQCGTTCCTAEETCVNNCCVANGGGSSVYYGSPATSFYTVTATTSQAGTAPYRPTSDSTITQTLTGSSATRTESYIAPVGTDGATLVTKTSNSGGLSGGAIAGIVIGVIAGIILLLLICACCCFKGLIDGVLAIFGLGPRSRRRRTEETIIEERRHSSGNVGRRTWFGTRASRPDRRDSGGGGIGLAGVGAALATLAVVLGLKRRHDRKNEKSDYSSSYYDSEYTSSSSASSDRRTRDSRRSRR